MKPHELAKLSDDELLEVTKNLKASPVTDAFLIGFLIGICIYGAAANAWGFTLLIPLFLIYRLLKKPKQYEVLQNELKARKLK